MSRVSSESQYREVDMVSRDEHYMSQVTNTISHNTASIITLVKTFVGQVLLRLQEM